MIFQGKDGEIRIHDYGYNGTTHYLEILFTDMNYNGPISRSRTEERLIMDRGNFDSNAHYVEGNDEPRYAPLDFSISCKLNDSVNTRVLAAWLSGVTTITNVASATTSIYSWKGKTTIDGNTLPEFRDSKKMAYRTEVLWDGTSDFGIRNEEVYFPPNEQNIVEAEDGITLNIAGKIYGDVTRITAFSGTTQTFY